MQAKFRKVIPDRLLPIKASLIHQRAKPVDVNDFVIEQLMKCVFVVTGKLASTSRRP